MQSFLRRQLRQQVSAHREALGSPVQDSAFNHPFPGHQKAIRIMFNQLSGFSVVWIDNLRKQVHACSFPRLLQLHMEVSMAKILNHKLLLMSRLATYLAASVISM